MRNKKNVVKLVVMAMLCGIAIILQAFASFITIPITNSSPALSFIPISVGAILYGPLAGSVLGFIWSLFILVSGQASYYMGMNAVGTVIVVVAKGTLAGLASGFVYKLFKKKFDTIGMVLASLVAPLVNSLVYRIGLVVFFSEYFFGKAESAGQNPVVYFISAFLVVSFLIEVGISAVFSPIITRICRVGRKTLGLEEEALVKKELDKEEA